MVFIGRELKGRREKKIKRVKAGWSLGVGIH